MAPAGKREALRRIFLEAKWFYNWVVADIEERLNDETAKVKTVEIKVENHFEERELLRLPAQVKQEMLKEIRQALKALSTQKKNGRRVGKLKFKSRRTTISLKQPGNTFRFLNSQRTKVRIQNLGKFRVLGARNVPEQTEVAKGFLQARADGYHLLLVCYMWPEDERQARKHKEDFKQAIGVDLGIKEQVVFSNGLRVAWQVEENERLKRVQTLYNKIKAGELKVKRPKRKLKRLKRIMEREHLRIKYRRKDIENKLVSYFKRYDVVVFQNDSIKAWHEGWFGRQVQHSALGGLTARLKALKESPATPGVKVVPKFLRTSSVCARCNAVFEIRLSVRKFRCPDCGWVCDRDWNAALAMLKATVGLGRSEGGLEQKELLPMPEEAETLIRIFGKDGKIVNPYVRVSQSLPEESLTL